MLADSKITSKDVPVIAFSVGENELKGMDTAPLVGHLSAWNYFMSSESEENDAFITAWHKFTCNDNRVTNDPMEATVIGFNMWAKAVEISGTTDVDTVRPAMYGLTIPNLTGGIAVMNTNHHLTKPVLIGEILDDGQFEIVYETPAGVIGDAWTDFLPESANLIADWTSPISCGNYNIKTGKCSGQNY